MYAAVYFCFGFIFSYTPACMPVCGRITQPETGVTGIVSHLTESQASHSGPLGQKFALLSAEPPCQC